MQKASQVEPSIGSVQLAVTLFLVQRPYRPNPQAPPLVRPKCVERCSRQYESEAG